MFDRSPAPAPLQPKAVGTITVVLTVYPDGEPGHAITLGNGTVVHNPGHLLGDLLARFGGPEGTLVDPIRGESHPVSLAPWSNLDPAATRVLVAYQLTRPGHTASPVLPASATS